MMLELLFAAGVFWILLRAVRQYARFLPVDSQPRSPSRAPVALIVPMRNEKQNAAACLDAISHLDYPPNDLDIIAVDDASTDGTRHILAARANAHLRLLTLDHLPPGWTGKSHACWQAAQLAGPATEFLCFLDADVRVSPALLQRAVAHAHTHHIDLLSLSPLQEMGTLWERLILPAGFLLLAATEDLGAVNDPRSPIATANGQFLLIRRDIYQAVGGHKSVRTAVAEDGALATRIKRAGHRVALLDGRTLLRVRMYHSLPELWEGLTKNIPQMLHGIARAAAAGILAIALAVAAVALPALATIHIVQQPTPAHIAALVLAWSATLALLGMHIGIARQFRFPILYAFLFPAAYLLGAALVFSSVIMHARGKVSWKGRTYAPESHAEAATPQAASERERESEGGQRGIA